MNINEAEISTGLTRANIRFYEKEGLIQVERLDNRYRNYSSENINDLKKIVLLRRLGLSVDTIRSIKDGQADMGQELMERMGHISGEMDELRTAKAICGKMLDDHISFADMDAAKYMGLFDSVKSDILKKDVPEKGHPWRRFFAAYTDMFFYGTALDIIVLLISRDMTVTGSLDILFYIFTLALMFFVEPLFLMLFATTPGKRLFGIYVYRYDGKKLTYVDGLYRCFYRMKDGWGFYIPIYSLYRLYKSFEACSENEMLPWDEEYATEVKIKGFSWKNKALWGASVAAAFGITLFMTLALSLPPNKGRLTPEEFLENYNYCSKYRGYDIYIDMDKKDGDLVTLTEMPYQSDRVTVTLGPLFSQKQLYFLTDDEGFVSEAGFVIDGNEDLYYNSWTDYEYRIMWAVMMADENVFTYSGAEDFMMDTMDGIFNTDTHNYGNYTVKKDVEMTGYRFEDENIIKGDSQDRHFYLKWSISRAGDSGGDL